MMSLTRFAHSLEAPDADVPPVCGGRRFRRCFSKKDYPLLGEDEDEDEDKKAGDEAQVVVLSGHGRDRLPVSLSLSVRQVRSWYCNPQTGKWRWPENGADLVYPGIFLGDASTALCVRLLKELDICGVLNTAQGSMSDWNYVNTRESYYAGTGIQFHGIPAIDLKHYPIQLHFAEGADFIDKVLKDKGCVLVHCVQGISRSATLVLAYLITRKKMTLQQAVDTVRSRRSIAPNEGFTEQLIELNDRVHQLTKKKNSLTGRKV